MLEESSRPVKVVLMVLLVALLAVLFFIFLTQRGLIGKKATTVAPVTSIQPPAEEVSPQKVDSSEAVPTVPTALTSEDKKEIGSIQDQINAGTLSPEEAMKLLNTINTRITPPTPTVKVNE